MHAIKFFSFLFSMPTCFWELNLEKVVFLCDDKFWWKVVFWKSQFLFYWFSSYVLFLLEYLFMTRIKSLIRILKINKRSICWLYYNYFYSNIFTLHEKLIFKLCFPCGVMKIKCEHIETEIADLYETKKQYYFDERKDSDLFLI